MADGPRRGGRLPEGRSTLPLGAEAPREGVRQRQMTPAPAPTPAPPHRDGSDVMGGRPTQPMQASTLAAALADEPAARTLPPGRQAVQPEPQPSRAGRFVSPSDPNVRTNVRDVPAGRSERAPAPSGRTERMGAAGGRDRLLPDATEHAAAAVEAAPRERITTPTPAVLTPSPSAPEPELAAPGEPTKVWVATHKAPLEPDPRLLLLREPDSERAASFRVLRHRLQQQGDPRCIAVSSASDGEGKTTCAVNLAMALGECGRARVLLVEANLRTPALAALFGFLPPDCFAAQMTRHRERPLEPWSVVEAFSPSLHVLAVKPGQESRPLLDGPAFAIAIDQLRRARYDYLVLDTPAVLGSADVNSIEDSADGVLLTAWAGQTSSRALRRAVEQLSPTRVLGITLLDV